jgi:hypothetical protein
MPGARRQALVVTVVAVVAFATAVALFGSGGEWLNFQDRGSGGETGRAGGGPTSPGVMAPTAPPTTDLRPVDLRPNGAPPWSASKLVPGGRQVFLQVAMEEWNQAANKSAARLVLPADLALSPIAIPRRSNVPGGWGVEWDDSGRPGVLPNGTFCETCGRAVAGVVALGANADKPAVLRSPITVQWNDGSAAGYSGSRTDNRFVATLFVTGQGHAYQVWSYVSQRHLEYVISQLRYVEGAP